MKNLLVGYKYAKLFAADQCLCFHYTDSTISLYRKSEIASLLPSPVALQLGLCPTWLETRKTGFLAMHLSCIENISLNASVEKSSENVDGWTVHVSLCLYLTYEPYRPRSANKICMPV